MSVTNKTISVDDSKHIPFHNNVDFCVGTGRIGLALTREYQEQLRFVQEKIGFRHIRGHGLFCDDMAIYQEYETGGEKRVEYNFTYLDRVMDYYREVGLRPFLELGFMPSKLASGTQTIFYWRGNTTPPRDYDEWCRLVTATLRHLIDRYGADEVTQYPVEVWNEPNLFGFWEHADMAEYFKLFHRTFETVKAVDQRFCVGGPAVCGGTDEIWIRAFMEYCRDNGLRPDFVTRHHYTIEHPHEDGHYAYAKLMDPEYGFSNLQTTRDIIDSFDEYRGLPIHITEFNTSYTPKGVIHDTNLNAAFLAHQLSRLGDVNESYSYWTFGDVFEELGVPYTIFHGGFGLVAEGCIPKPTFWTFEFYKKLQESGGECVFKDDNAVILKRKNGGYLGILWNVTTGDGEDNKNITVSLPSASREWALLTRTVDEDTCNPLKVWHDLGEHPHPDTSELQLIRESASPLVKTERLTADRDRVSHEFRLGRNSVIYFELRAESVSPDRGYHYEKVSSQDI